MIKRTNSQDENNEVYEDYKKNGSKLCSLEGNTKKYTPAQKLKKRNQVNIIIQQLIINP